MSTEPRLKGLKVLVLGYKQFGFGVSHYSPIIAAGIEEWRLKLHRHVGKLTLSFDNLAIEQLNVRRLFIKEGWEQFYMGDDFQFTMYIDAVKQEFAPTSLSSERQPFTDYSLISYFQKFKKPG